MFHVSVSIIWFKNGSEVHFESVTGLKLILLRRTILSRGVGLIQSIFSELAELIEF